MDAYDYVLPETAIAQEPVEPRDSARMLTAEPDGGVRHLRVRDLPRLLGPGDVLVVNDTKVLPARLALRKPTGGAVEVVLLAPLDGDTWEGLVRPSRRVAPGTRLCAGGREVVEVGDGRSDGTRVVRLLGPLDDHASLALPPYIRRPLADPGRYQTVYAAHPGSVAAPTAGLHLTRALLSACRRAGADVRTVDLAVGLGTFRPVTAERPEDHVMHEERYRVPSSTIEACRRAERVVAVGTTTLRALESAAASGVPAGTTSLLIHGDYRFRVVDVLLTNFHVPRSSLLLLLADFCGNRWRELYGLALREGYRFLSFGDAMLVARRPGGPE